MATSVPARPRPMAARTPGPPEGNAVAEARVAGGPHGSPSRLVRLRLEAGKLGLLG